nr:tetratricopeptide repeat protein [Desulfobacterales bacterium]
MEQLSRNHSNSSNCIVFSLLSLFVIALFSPIRSHAQHQIYLSPDRQFSFAETYFEKGQYFRAVSEYQRFIFFFPKDPRVKLALFRIGMSYFKGKRFRQAIRSFRKVIDQYPHAELAFKSWIKISESFLGLKKYDVALLNLSNLIKTTSKESIHDEAYYRMGWIYLERGDWEKARISFDKISTDNKKKYRLRRLFEQMDKKKELKLKDPAAAGVLAIVPGAGHIYCERYRDALVSFMVNGILIFAAYEAFSKDQEALGGIISFVELGFYTGNIYSAITCAHKYNRNVQNRFLLHLKKHIKVNLSFNEKRGKAVMVNLCFPVH